MRGLASAAFIILAGMTSCAWAEEQLQQGRSAATCSESVLVCEIDKNGTLTPTSECKAREDRGVVRYLYGDCYDED